MIRILQKQGLANRHSVYSGRTGVKWSQVVNAEEQQDWYRNSMVGLLIRKSSFHLDRM